MTPSIGRIVHYVSHGTPGGEYKSECRAAIITAAEPTLSFEREAVGLAVFNPTGIFLNEHVPHSEQKRGGTWHWPERTD